MGETTEGASGGTVEETGSQAQVAGQVGASAEDAAAAAEATVTIGDQQVPLSVAQNALKVHERFTQESQASAERTRTLEAREAALLERETAIGSAQGIIDALRNPEVAERIKSVAPELLEKVPSAAQQANVELLGENLRLKYEAFARSHGEFSEEQLAGIRGEMRKLIQAGKLEEATDFESIGYRLYREDIIAARATALAAEQAKKAEEDAEQRRKAGGHVGPGVPAIPVGVDIDKLDPIQKISLGRRLREMAAGK